MKCVAGPRQKDSSQISARDDDSKIFDLPQTSTQQHFGNSGALADAVDNDMEQAVPGNFLTLLQDFGFSPQKISELLQELPHSNVSDALIDFYFSTMYVELLP